MSSNQPILIAGGGPVGLVAAYALGQQGIPVIVFDDNDELQLDPRAATTHPASFRNGWVLLAGDSCHVNNSIGGMGLNGGIQDAMNLTGKLTRVIKGEARDSVLDLYDLQRRTFATDFVQEQTIQNKKRLEARDSAQRKNNLDELRATAADPARARQFLLKSSMITDMRRVAEMRLD
ncbi:MAG: FAD-dependent monooxygenase [Alphaproteobacteria bacterium]